MSAFRNFAFGYSRDVRGGTATIFALALVPIAAIIGAEVDYARGNATASKLQAGVDFAALATVENASAASAANALAAQSFNSNFHASNATATTVSGVYGASDGSVTVTATTTIPTYFGSLLGQPGYTITRSAKAMMGAGGAQTPVCLLITDADAGHSLKTAGKSRLDIYNCMVQVNTSDWDAVQADDTSYIHIDTPDQAGNWNCYVGEIHFGDVSPAKQPSCALLPDPYKSMALPSVAYECTDNTNYAVSSGAFAFSPGTYCGDIKITGNANVTFKPGIYTFAGNTVSIQGNSNVTGDGVVFILTGVASPTVVAPDPASEWIPAVKNMFTTAAGKSVSYKDSQLQIQTNGNVSLTAYQGSEFPALKGFLMFQDQSIFAASDCACGQPMQFENANIVTSGILYLADIQLTLQGVDWTHTGSLVADMFLPNQNSRVTLNGSTSSSLTKTTSRSTMPTLVR